MAGPSSNVGRFSGQVHPSSDCRHRLRSQMDFFTRNGQLFSSIFYLGGKIQKFFFFFVRNPLTKILHGTIVKMNRHVSGVEEEYHSAVSRSQNASIKVEEGSIFKNFHIYKS